jgi:7-cyano-7-deazaguanine synthase
MSRNNKAIILLSGGLDSTTTLSIAASKGLETYALSFDYGQKNRFELSSAEKIAKTLNVKEHKIVTIGLGTFGGSSLTSNQKIELDRSMSEIGHGIPSTYVPVRNLIFLSYAVAWAEVIEAQDIFIGVNAVDFSGYPDCRPAFIESFSKTANFASKLGTTGSKISIHTPLINLTKAEIIKIGLDLCVDYRLTSTCYQPKSDGSPCTRCDSCKLRAAGFASLGVTDPIIKAVN